MKVVIHKRRKAEWPAVFATVSPLEAHDLIVSLAGQLAHESPNSGRIEFSPREGASYFSIAIDFEGVATVATMLIRLTH